MEDDCVVSQADFVWNVLIAFFSNKKVDDIIEIISKMYDSGVIFSTTIESLLLACWQTPITENLIELAKESLKQDLFGINKHYYVVSKLYSIHEISADEAVSLLNIHPKENNEILNERVEALVDALWLVNEDLKDGFKKPSDDDFLGGALLTLSEGFL